MVGFALATFGFCLGLRPIGDNSFFTHLETGRLILESGIPKADPYSFTAPGEPWVVQSWLASLLYALSERALGATGVRLLTGVLVGVLVALVWRLTRPAKGLAVRILVVGLVIIVGANFWAPRPLLFGLVFFALLLVIHEDRRDPRWAIPIMWLWVNTHGSFPLGLAAIAVLALGIRLDKGDTSRSLRLLGWAALGTLAAAISPLGPVLLTFPVHLLGRSEFLQRVVEWQSPSFSVTWARVFLVQVLVAVVLLVRRPSYRNALPMVVFVAAALIALRNIPVASIMLVPGMARGLQGIGGLQGRERGPVAIGTGVVTVAVGLLAAVALLGQPAYDLTGYPTDALVWAEQHGVGPRTIRLATEDTTGNLIEVLDGTSAKVFLDDRYDMYPRSVMEDYLRIHGGAAGWDKALRDQGVDCVLWGRSDPLMQLLAGSSTWSIRYQDAQSVVACRRDVALTEPTS